MTVSISAWYPLVRNLRACSTRFGVLASPSRSGSSPSSESKRLIRSCIRLLYLCIMAVPVAAQTASVPPQTADALYADRANLESARRAAELWTAGLAANPRDFPTAWKLARADYWLGGHAAASDRQMFYEAGIA